MADSSTTRSISSTIKRMLSVRTQSITTGERSSNSERALFVDSGPDITPAIISRLQKAQTNNRYRTDLVAIVLPPGHGKTYFAKRYGWIDIDSLIRGERYQEVYESMARRLTSERDWVKSMHTLAAEAGGTLSIMRHASTGVVMLQCEHQAAYLGLRIIGSYVLDDELVQKSIECSDAFRRQLALLGSAVAREMGASRMASRVELEEDILMKLAAIGMETGATSVRDRYQWQALMRSWSALDVITTVNRGAVSAATARFWTGSGENSSGCRLLMSDDWVMLQLSGFGAHDESITVPHFERKTKTTCCQGIANVSKVACDLGVPAVLLAEVCMRHDHESEEFVSSLISAASSITVSNSMCKQLLYRMLMIPRRKIAKACIKLISMSKRNALLGWDLRDLDRGLLTAISACAAQGDYDCTRLLPSSPFKMVSGQGRLIPKELTIIDLARARAVIARHKELEWLMPVAAQREGYPSVTGLIGNLRGMEAVKAAMYWLAIEQAYVSHSKRRERRIIKAAVLNCEMISKSKIVDRYEIEELAEGLDEKWDPGSAFGVAYLTKAKGDLTSSLLELVRARRAATWARVRLGATTAEVVITKSTVGIQGLTKTECELAGWLSGNGKGRVRLIKAIVMAGIPFEPVAASGLDWRDWSQTIRLGT
ncbi:RNA-dependent RNA polymerase, partial [viral metagenome]